MQQKTLKYVLTTGVIAIWGIVIYQVIAAQNGRRVVVKASSPEMAIAIASADSFTINIDYPDPFLPDSSTVLHESPGEAGLSSSQPSPPIIDQPKVDLTFIQYNGMISNPKKRNKVAIIQMHGREYLIREGEEFGEVFFSRIRKEELLIMINGKKHKIPRLR